LWMCRIEAAMRYWRQRAERGKGVCMRVLVFTCVPIFFFERVFMLSRSEEARKRKGAEDFR
jgi:hypothetical protein